MTYAISSEQDEYAARARALVRVEAVADASSPASLGAPDGVVHIAWRHFDGFERLREITHWRRIDQEMMANGAEFTISIQARQYRDLRLPLYSMTRRARLTCNRDDVDLLAIGNVAAANGWRFGVRLLGAVLLPDEATLPQQPHP